MQPLANKIVFITGASSGIGKAAAEHCAAQGAHLILTARRIDRINNLAQQLTQKYSIKVLPILLDVCDNNQVKKVIAELPSFWQAIDILINNAGLALTTDKMQDANIENWDTMIDTNIKGLLYVTHAILPFMIARNQGHIVNIGSITGRDYYPAGNVYCATKHAVKAISQSLRLDLLGKAIRVTEIAPGLVETEFSTVRWQDAEKAKAFYARFTPLTADDIADAIVYCITRPAHVDVAEMIITPTDQASVHHINTKNDVSTNNSMLS